MATPNLSEIIATTSRNRTKKLADNVTKNNALLFKLKQKGKVKPFRGGRTIVQELEFQENQTYTRYSGYETLNIAPSEVITAAEYNIKQAAVAVSISGLEQLQNNSKEALIDLLESRLSNAEKTLVNNIALDCYSDGTADGGKQIGGLAHLVSSTPASGTVGGINRATWSFWQNIADTGTTSSAANIQTLMNTVYLQLKRGADKPDLIVAGNTKYQHYLESLQAIQRIGTSDMAEAGFDSLRYMQADVVCDGGVDGGATATEMFFLNTDYIHFRPHSDRNFKSLGAERYALNQDASTSVIAWAGNMTLSCAFLQAVLTDYQE